MTTTTEIPQWFKDQFATNWEHLAQQKDSRLKDYATMRSFKGKRKGFNQLGTTTWRPLTSRNAKTTPQDTDKAKRWLNHQAFDWVVWEDEFDQDMLAEIAAPRSAEIESAVFAWNRLIDTNMALAALGTSYSGETGVTPETLPAGQQVAVNYVESGSAANSGLTLGKLRKANSLFGLAEVDENEPRVMAVTQLQLDDLLKTVEVTNNQYNAVQALVDGVVDKFMGFTFKRVNSLPVASGVRSCVAWVKSGIWYNMGERKTHIDVLPQQNHTMQVRLVGDFAATRSEEAKVVQIFCAE